MRDSTPQSSPSFPPCQHLGEGADVGVPAAVVEHVQRDARVLRRRDQLPAAVGVRGERLVGDRRDAGGEGLQDEGAAGLGRGGDGDRVDSGGQQVGQGVVGGYVGEVGGQLGAPLRRAGDDAGQLDVARRGDERGVEVPAAHPVPDQSQPHVSSSVRHRASMQSMPTSLNRDVAPSSRIAPSVGGRGVRVRGAGSGSWRGVGFAGDRIVARIGLWRGGASGGAVGSRGVRTGRGSGTGSRRPVVGRADRALDVAPRGHHEQGDDQRDADQRADHREDQQPADR